MSDNIQRIQSVENNLLQKDMQQSGVQIGEKFDIQPGKRLPDFDMGEVKAYRVIERNGTGKYFGLVCEPHLVPRFRSVPVYASIANPSLASLVEVNVIDWPPAKQQRCIFVYRDNLGNRLLKEGEKPALGWKQDAVMASVVTPLIAVLQDFRNKDFVHGAIRVSNMFDGGKAKVDKIMLGECLATPASYLQPALYETIPRSMADPISRGPGTLADDMYALGVSLAVLMRSNDPLEGLSRDEIIKEKIIHGSYAAVTGKDRFKGSILELLRGLLHDDLMERWTIDEVMTWVDGRRLSPKQTIPVKKAARPISFSGNKYLQQPLLAMDLNSNPSEVVKIIESRELEQWLKRSVEDEEALERVVKAEKLASDNGKDASYEEKLISNLSMALDPVAPVRYSGLSLMGDGVGTALAEAFVLKKNIKPFVEMFLQGTFLNWLMVLTRPSVDIGGSISKFDSCRNFLRQTRIGFGIERCVYLLCPEVQCLSEKLSRYFVRTPEDLVLAFEDLCQQGKLNGLFLDRHSAAFISVKDSKSIDPYLHDFEAGELYKKVMGNLKCFATIQKRSNMKPLPHIAQNLMSNIGVVLERYHDREIREKLKKGIERYAEAGDLVKMAGLLDNVEVMTKDMEAYRAAIREYRELTEEARSLEISMQNRGQFGITTGRDAAAIISGILSVIVILFLTFAAMTKKSFF